MNNRWFGTQTESKHADSRPSESRDASGSPRFPREEASWRSWLATGARRAPIDRRRARGAEAQLKKILVGGPSGAVDFSSAMARQAVDEALHELPPRQRQVVKLAYSAGLTNREIAQELGLSVSEVRRALRASLATVGAHFERGRAKGRRAIQDLLLLPWWRSLGMGAHRAQLPALDYVLQTGIVAVMTAAAAALLVGHQAPAHAGHAHQPPHVAAAGSVGSNPQSQPETLVAAVEPAPRPGHLAGTLSHSVSVPAAALMIKAPLGIPIPITVPPVLLPPPPIGLPQLPLGA